MRLILSSLLSLPSPIAPSISLSHSMLLLLDTTSCDPSQRGSAAVSQLAVPATEATSPPPPPSLNH